MIPIDFEALFGASPNPYVLVDPGFAIVAANEAYLRVTMRDRASLVGRNMFEAFPSDPNSEGHRLLRTSLERAVRTGERDHLPMIRYDIPRPDGSGLDQRFWSATHTPLRGPDGAVALILQHTVDVTELHGLREMARRIGPSGAVAQIESDVIRRAEAVQEANSALEEERRWLESLFEQAPGFMAVLEGPEHRFAMTNAAYQGLIGGREVVGLPVAEALPEVVGQGFVDLLDRVRESREPFVGRQYPVRLAQSPGAELEERFIDFIYQPILEDGAVTGIFVQGHDVTETKRAEDALRESEGRFRLVADSAPVKLWMSGPDGNCVYLNRAHRIFWGLPEEAVAGFDLLGAVHPEDQGVFRTAHDLSLRDRTGFTSVARFRRHDGAWRTLRTEAQARFAPDGAFLGLIGVNVDITEMHEVEDALRREKRVLEVLNGTGTAIAAELDLDRVVQMVTDAGVELSGAKFGAFFYNVLDDKGASYMLYALSGVERSAFENFPMPRATAVFQPTFQGEGVIRSDDITADPRYGRTVPYGGMPPGHLPVRSYLAVPVTSRSGEVLGGLFFGHPQPGRFKAEHEALLRGVAGQAAVAIDNARLYQSAQRDIRHRRRAEEQLRQLNETLEARVATEIAERRQAEAALAQAQKMESIGKLTGGVAHDFNNLLQVVSGNLQLLLRDVAGNERAERRLTNAMAGVSRGAKLAAQLLAFGRRQALEPKVVNIGRLLAGMEDLLRRSIGEAVEIETVVSGGLWNTLIDPVQIENALLNLAINARDAMEGAGKLTIEVGNAFIDDAYARAHPEVNPGQYVMLAVTDTGCGMPPEVQAMVFEPFFSTKAEGKGSGLGLSMVYGFVKQSGGHVKIYSEVGQGTTVKLYLPRARKAEDVVVSVEGGPVTGGTETILVAEDDDAVRATVVELLTELGYRVLKARDAASALSVVESGVPIDLLFTDVVMPGPMKSTELARRARERLPGLSVLFTSGYTENSIVHGGRLDEGVELLSKPYTREALARKLRHVLASSAGRGVAAPVPEPAPEPAGPARVLLVEDDPMIRAGTAEMLRDAGHEVAEAGSAEAALDRLREAEVDVVVTDLGLPGLSGDAFAREARALRPGIGVVFATGRDEAPEDAPDGAVVLRKPYDAAGLVEAVRKAGMNAG
ncbi:hybrid sensor histidine kinase/response regulator [Roseomonas populi]|uniref:histidine kinase n=1 Tax=Roseomonas populi TaxID=3121582 RepID=A0ABT1XBX9_9PROT|nr:response regulator [Roseomonas pecuniae]MCR0985641.1 response regulator [Roseomonas pecuniae]